MVLCNPIKDRFKYVCPDREFCSEITQNVIFSGKIGKPGKIEKIFRIFEFFCFRSIYNVKIHFLSKFCQKIWIFEEVTSFSVFTNLKGHWPGFTKIPVGSFQKKAVTFEVKQLESSNFAISFHIWWQIIKAFRKKFRL